MRALLGVAVLVAGVTAGSADAASPRALLPNLVPLRTTALEVRCDPTEIAGDTPTPARCLRFETRAANAGSGPVELHNRADELAAARSVTQRIRYSDGSSRDADVGTYVFHAAHAHFHYSDFAVASLWRSDARGRRLDKAPVRRGHKAGFCLQDVYAYREAGPASYEAPAACYPVTVEDDGVTQVSGISPGWVDVYDLTVPHQYVEITGIPDGYYLLQIALDPEKRLRERTTKDNAVWQHIRLCGAKADLVGRTATCG